MKWEYKVIKKQEATGGILAGDYLTIDELNKLGDDGWELVSYCSESDISYSVAIFKRPKN